MIKIYVSCPKHPTYTGKRKPRVNCSTCHDMFHIRWRASTVEQRRPQNSDRCAGIILQDNGTIKVGVLE